MVRCTFELDYDLFLHEGHENILTLSLRFSAAQVRGDYTAATVPGERGGLLSRRSLRPVRYHPFIGFTHSHFIVSMSHYPLRPAIIRPVLFQVYIWSACKR